MTLVLSYEFPPPEEKHLARILRPCQWVTLKNGWRLHNDRVRRDLFLKADVDPSWWPAGLARVE